MVSPEEASVRSNLHGPDEAAGGPHGAAECSVVLARVRRVLDAATFVGSSRTVRDELQLVERSLAEFVARRAVGEVENGMDCKGDSYALIAHALPQLVARGESLAAELEQRRLAEPTVAPQAGIEGAQLLTPPGTPKVESVTDVTHHAGARWDWLWRIGKDLARCTLAPLAVPLLFVGFLGKRIIRAFRSERSARPERLETRMVPSRGEELLSKFGIPSFPWLARLFDWVTREKQGHVEVGKAVVLQGAMAVTGCYIPSADGRGLMELEGWLAGQGEPGAALLRDLYRDRFLPGGETLSLSPERLMKVTLRCSADSRPFVLPVPTNLQLVALEFRGRFGAPLGGPSVSVRECVLGGADVLVPKGATRVTYWCMQRALDIPSSDTRERLLNILPKSTWAPQGVLSLYEQEIARRHLSPSDRLEAWRIGLGEVRGTFLADDPILARLINSIPLVDEHLAASGVATCLGHAQFAARGICRLGVPGVVLSGQLLSRNKRSLQAVPGHSVALALLSSERRSVVIDLTEVATHLTLDTFDRARITERYTRLVTSDIRKVRQAGKWLHDYVARNCLSKRFSSGRPPVSRTIGHIIVGRLWDESLLPHVRADRFEEAQGLLQEPIFRRYRYGFHEAVPGSRAGRQRHPATELLQLLESRQRAGERAESLTRWVGLHYQTFLELPRTISGGFNFEPSIWGPLCHSPLVIFLSEEYRLLMLRGLFQERLTSEKLTTPVTVNPVYEAARALVSAPLSERLNIDRTALMNIWRAMVGAYPFFQELVAPEDQAQSRDKFFLVLREFLELYPDLRGQLVVAALEEFAAIAVKVQQPYSGLAKFDVSVVVQMLRSIIPEGSSAQPFGNLLGHRILELFRYRCDVALELIELTRWCLMGGVQLPRWSDRDVQRVGRAIRKLARKDGLPLYNAPWALCTASSIMDDLGLNPTLRRLPGSLTAITSLGLVDSGGQIPALWPRAPRPAVLVRYLARNLKVKLDDWYALLGDPSVPLTALPVFMDRIVRGGGTPALLQLYERYRPRTVSKLNELFEQLLAPDQLGSFVASVRKRNGIAYTASAPHRAQPIAEALVGTLILGRLPPAERYYALLKLRFDLLTTGKLQPHSFSTKRFPLITEAQMACLQDFCAVYPENGGMMGSCSELPEALQMLCVGPQPPSSERRARELFNFLIPRGDDRHRDMFAQSLSTIDGSGDILRFSGGYSAQKGLKAPLGSSGIHEESAPYVQGDDIKRLDQIAMARTDRLMTKRYRDHEARPALFLVDSELLAEEYPASLRTGRNYRIEWLVHRIEQQRKTRCAHTLVFTLRGVPIDPDGQVCTYANLLQPEWWNTAVAKLPRFGPYDTAKVSTGITRIARVLAAERAIGIERFPASSRLGIVDAGINNIPPNVHLVLACHPSRVGDYSEVILGIRSRGGAVEIWRG